MTAARRSKTPSDAEILDELAKRVLAHIAWSVINTKDKSEEVDALPKDQQVEVRKEIQTQVSKLTPQQLLEKKKKKKSALDGRSKRSRRSK